MKTNVPNLDAFTDADELWQWGMRLTARQHASALFPEGGKGTIVAARNLQAYAVNKSVAVRCRLKGDIIKAMEYEAICERIYNELPEWAKW